MKKLFVLAVLLFGIAGQAGATKYVVRDLGVLPGTVSSEAKGVNDSGEVVGQCIDDQGNYHAFYWSAAKGMVELKPLAGDKHCIAHAINNKGLIAGGSGKGGQDYRIVLWKAAAQVTTGPRYTEARAVNEVGQAAGGSKYNTAGIRNTNGKFTHLGNGMAFGINNSGQAVGERYDSSQKANIAIYWDGAGNSLDLGNGMAYDINDGGQIVGTSNKSAVAWDREGNMRVLPTLRGHTNGAAESINNAGQIVGTLGGSAVLWNPDGTVTTLSRLPGGSQTSANCISENGLIVGQAKDATGIFHAVLWEPVLDR